jgi:hypothetical protein
MKKPTLVREDKKKAVLEAPSGAFRVQVTP